jgi:N-acetylglucosaminyldiphosphoundecaprenol N-acetyl-beta-D-mannosaminyltransferase
MKVVSINLTLIIYQRALEEVMKLGESRTSSYVCFANAHMVVESSKSLIYQQYVNRATFAFADGMPLVFALRLLYRIKQDRVAGMDFMLDILQACNANQLSIFLYGSTASTLDSLNNFISENFSNIDIVGSISPPFRDLSEEENLDMIEKINLAKPNFVFVGLGCPKQEIWMARNSNNINACLLGVGGAFGIYAGNMKRAPLWMCNSGLEWLFRLWQEPRRLLKRYTVTNTQFIYLFLKQLLSHPKA